MKEFEGATLVYPFSFATYAQIKHLQERGQFHNGIIDI